MLEKPGDAHCASAFAANGCPPTTVYAAPVFVPVTTDTDSLPLQERVLPLPAALAALTTWCTGYGYTLYEEAAS